MQRLLTLLIAVTLTITAGGIFAQSKDKSKPAAKKGTAQILAERQKELNAPKTTQPEAAKDAGRGAEKAAVNSPNRSSVAPSTPAVLDNPAYAPLAQIWSSMSKEQQGELLQRLMTADLNSITELSALPGNTQEEKRMFLVRFLQSQGIEVPGAPPLSAPALGQGEAFLTDAAGNPAAVKPVVELISQDGAQSEEPPLPLYKQSPFDEVILSAKFENAVIKLMPLPFRTTPAEDDPIRKKYIKVRLVAEPETDYNLVWSAIERFHFFEDMIVEKAIELSKQGKFEESFVYIRFLLDEYPQCKGSFRALEQLYFDEAMSFSKAKKYDAALARLMEIYDTYPKSARVEKPMAKIVDILVQQYIDKDDYLSARIMTNNLLSRFPQNEIGLKWRKLFVGQCQQACDEAQAALSAKKMAQAALAVEQMKHVWPSCEDVKNGVEIIKQIETQYPSIRVGVTLPSSNCVNVSINDWASYRSRRLMYRLMMEFKGPGPEGGTYDSPLGTVVIEDLGRRLVFNLNGDLRWASQAGGDNLSLSGADVAGALLEMANRQSETYSPQWASLFKCASVPSPMETVIQLNRPYVCPFALLQNPVLCYTSGNIGEEISAGANGPYVPGVLPAQERLGAKEKLYLFNERYFASEPAQPKMITEVYYDKGQNALKDLSSGRIAALDKINPWEVDGAQQNKSIHVYPYSIPLVHCLVPNRNKLLLSNRTYRRALVYALNREGILRNLVGGSERQGCLVVSGPFSPGIEANDPLGYAYDFSLKPRSYSPYLAFALTQAAMLQIDKAQKKPAEKDAKARGITVEQLEAEKKAEAEKIAGEEKKAEAVKAEAGKKTDEKAADSAEKTADSKKKKKKDLFEQKFVLGYPPHETARIACQIIARQYKAIGIEIELHEFAPGEPVCMSDEIDLLYMEMAMYEPIVDAPRILSAAGPSGKCSIHVEQALRELDGATDWESLGQTMRRLHRLAYDDTAVIPLWQIRDYFGVNANIEGVAESEDTPIVSLYERIEEWSGKKESQQEKK